MKQYQMNDLLHTANAEQAERALTLARRHHREGRLDAACRLFAKSDNLCPLSPAARNEYATARAARRPPAAPRPATRPAAPPAAAAAAAAPPGGGGNIFGAAWRACAAAARRADAALDAALARWTHRRYRRALKLMLAAIAVLGAYRLVARASPLQAAGRLPGDVRWQNQSGNVQFYFPVVSCIGFSLLMNAIGWAWRGR